jgi:hypothetical protein
VQEWSGGHRHRITTLMIGSGIAHHRRHVVERKKPVAAAATRASAVARLRVPFCLPPVLRPRAIASNDLI